MEKIIEAFIKLIPFTSLFEKLGVSKELSSALALILFAIVAFLIKSLSAKLINRIKNYLAARDLSPHFDYQKVKSSRELFIRSQFQNQSPTREEEPLFTHKFVAKKLLIPFFIKTSFNEKKESDKFYLILADSGMGKTTFMINLYLQYNSVINFNKKYKIKLLPFGDPKILDRIKDIKSEDVPNTILLLDAFDEDRMLIPPIESDGLSDDQRFRRRLDEIIETVQDFREVVITSRTQYFPSQEDQPYELKIPRFDEKGFHTLAKFYISPFDGKEIRQYLNKKYGLLKFWNIKKKRKACVIVNNSTKLMVRPMLLSYIDLLVGSESEFSSVFQIYEVLIEKWIERESNKRKYKKSDREKFKQNLGNYSQLVAVEIYKQRQQSNMLYLSRQDALKVANENNIDIRAYEITGQSLLTRDANGNWKFAHKSILEFFIAKAALLVDGSIEIRNFTGMDMAQEFYGEKMPELVFVKGGNFIMGSPENEINHENGEIQRDVSVNDFYIAKHTVTVAQFELFINETGFLTEADESGGSFIWTGRKYIEKSNVNWRCDVKGEKHKDMRHPVIHVCWNDAVAYCKWLGEKYGKPYRLPTEEEWEFACRAGTTTPFNTGENLTSEQANYNGNFPYGSFPKGKYIGKTMPVGSYKPNIWGLYDMHGNVWEWCDNRYDKKGDARVLRGGGWSNNARDCRSAGRNYNHPDDRNISIGFRLVRGQKKK